MNASQLSDINPKKYLNKKLVPNETQRFKYLSRLTNHHANSAARSAKQAGVNKNLQDRLQYYQSKRFGFESPDTQLETDLTPRLEDRVIKIKIVDDAENVVQTFVSDRKIVLG